MRLTVLAGLYVAVVLSAQIGANEIIVLPLTHLEVYAVGIARALAQLARYPGTTRRDGALNALSGQLVGKIASSVLLGRRFLPANPVDIVTA